MIPERTAVKLPDNGVILGSELLVDSVQLCAVDQVDPGDDVVFVAEVDAVLSLWEASDERTHDGEFLEHERQLRHGVGAQHQTQLDQDSLSSEQRQVGVEVVVGRDRVEDQVQTVRPGLHILRVSGDNKVVRPDLLGSGLLVGGGGDGGDGVPHSLGNPHAHLSKTANTDDPDSLASLASSLK